MFKIRKTKKDELSIIFEIASQEHAKPFLHIKSMDDCKREFIEKNKIYLSVVSSSNIILGYIVLDRKDDKNSIQLKRILIRKENLGIGQEVLIKLEKYCIDLMNIKYIYLDVYEDNYKAIYIYEKLAYILFKTEFENKRKVLYYKKKLEVI